MKSQSAGFGVVSSNFLIHHSHPVLLTMCSSLPAAYGDRGLGVPAPHAHTDMMHAAIVEGERGRLLAPPNPWVGCVLTLPVEDPAQPDILAVSPDDGPIVHTETCEEGGRKYYKRRVRVWKIIGRGYHKGPGKPHAEVEAIREAEANGFTEQDFAKATLYTTLEPCHAGKGKRTPPCDELLVRKKVGGSCFDYLVVLVIQVCWGALHVGCAPGGRTRGLVLPPAAQPTCKFV